MLGVLFGALALALGVLFGALGAALGRRGPVYAATGAVAVLTYVANTLAPQAGGLAWAQKLSPFYYYAGGEPLRRGMQLGDVSVLLTMTAALVAIGAVAFDRCDVAV